MNELDIRRNSRKKNRVAKRFLYKTFILLCTKKKKRRRFMILCKEIL